MHSLAMAQYIIGAALAEANMRDVKRIKTINVKIRGEHFDESESLEYCLQVATEGTAAKDARIRVEILKAKVECLRCGFVFTPGSDLESCPRCKSRKLAALGNHGATEVILEPG